MEFILHDYNYLWAAMALISGGLLFAPMLRGSAFGVAPAEVVTLINRQDAIVLDVRDQNEFAAGHLINSRHIPANELKERTGELARFKNRPIVVVCQGGTRSSVAASSLRKAGFEQAVTLNGGIAAWKDAGLPIAKDS